MWFTAIELNSRKNPPLKSGENKESVELDPLEPWVRDLLAFYLISYKEFSSQLTERIKKKNQFQCKFGWTLLLLLAYINKFVP